mmetsp:Transcript_128613/g.222901  ORF Transcript_128613/g.222901 Transcript_128613/m.222901 type:complete len:1237 (-) Transcript_128613:64-3774(-)
MGKGQGRKDDASVHIRPHAFKVLAPEQLVGWMLGKRNNTTQKEEIQSATGARLTFSNREEYYPNSRLRIIIVHADNPSPVMAGVRRIVDRIVECSEPDKAPRSEPEFHTAIPSFLSEDILGYDDYYLKEIQRDSGASVSCNSEAYENHRLLRVSGSPASMHTAVEKIFRSMDRYSGQESFQTWAGLRHFPVGCTADTGTAQAKWASTDTWSDSASRQSKWDQSNGGSAAGASSDWQADRQYGGSSGSTRGYGESSTQYDGDKWRSAPGYDGDGYRSGGHGGHQVDMHSSSYNTSYDASYHSASQGSYRQRSRSRGQPHRPIGRPEDNQRDRGSRQRSVSRQRRSESRRCSRSRQVSRSGRKSPPRREPAPRKEPTPPRGEAAARSDPFLDVLTAISEDFPNGGLDKDYLVSCDLPGKRCGSLIGKRGEHVDFIQRVTGTRVKFEEDRNREDGCRQMSVVGKLLHCYAAHMLMMRRYLDNETSDGPSESEERLRRRLETIVNAGRNGDRHVEESRRSPQRGEHHRDDQQERRRTLEHHRDDQQDRKRTLKDDALYDIDGLAKLRRRAEEAGYLAVSPARHRSPGHAAGRRPSRSPRRSPRRGCSQRRSRSDARGGGTSRRGCSRSRRSPSHGQRGRNSSYTGRGGPDRGRHPSAYSGTDGYGGGSSMSSSATGNARTPNGSGEKGLPESTSSVESEGNSHRCVVMIWAVAKSGRGHSSYPMRGPKRSTHEHAHADGQRLLEALRIGGESEARRLQRMLQSSDEPASFGDHADAPSGLDNAAMDLMPSGFFEEILGPHPEEEFREEREGEVRVLGAAMLGVGPIVSWDHAVQQGYLMPAVRRSLPAMGLHHPTLIQRHSVPMISAKHCDVIAESPAGTGKTMAFVLPLLSRLVMSPAVSRPHFPGPAAQASPVLVFLSPARELVVQLGAKIREIAMRAQFTTATLVLCGSEPLAMQLKIVERQQFDIVCTTPERFVEAVGARKLSMAYASAIVVDNAEQLVVVDDLDPQVDRLLQERPATVHRQTLMFSSDFPVELAGQSANWLREISAIAGLKAKLFSEADGNVDCSVEGIHQFLTWVQSDEERVNRVAADLVQMLRDTHQQRAVVFINNGTLALPVLDALSKPPCGQRCGYLHGRLAENACGEVLHQFATGSVNILVVSNMSCRGIDVSGVSVVLQVDMPNSVYAYAQRVAKAGSSSSKSQALAYVSHRETPMMAELEEFLTTRGQVVPLWLRGYS